MPTSLGIARRHVIQVTSRCLVSTRYGHNIAQIDWHSSRRCCEQHVANLFRALEFGGRINPDIARLGLDNAARRSHISCAEDVFDFRWLQLESRKPVV